MSRLKAKQIIFNAQMARAIQDGHKTQTRRVIKNDFMIAEKGTYRYSIRDQKGLWNDFSKEEELIKFASKFQICDLLWAREPVKVIDYLGVHIKYKYMSDGNLNDIYLPKRFLKYEAGSPEIIVPKWVSKKAGIPNGCIKEMARTFLKITNVRVERLQDISERDIYKEGLETAKEPVSQDTMYGFGIDEVDGVVGINERDAFRYLWNKSVPKGCKWDDNPYVFVYEFEKLEDM